MEMRVGVTSAGLKLANIANGLLLGFRVSSLEYYFALTDSFSIGSGAFGFALLGTDWFKVKNSTKKISIREFHEKKAQIEISGAYGYGKIDVKFSIFDKNNQPFYSIEKINIPSRGFCLGGLKIREKIALSKIKYRGKIK